MRKQMMYRHIDEPHKMKRYILISLISVMFFSLSANSRADIYDHLQTAKSLRIELRPQYQAEYVRGMLDAFRFVAETNINLQGINECYKDEVLKTIPPYSVTKVLIEIPEKYEKSLKGIDWKRRPAVDAFALNHMYICEDYISNKIDVIKARKPVGYLLSGEQLINPIRLIYEYENMYAFMDAFKFLSQTEDRYTDIIECHRKHWITWFDVTGNLIKFIKRPWMFGSFPGDRKVKTGPAVEAFVMMNRKWCAQLDDHAEQREKEKKKK
jgi:hypothetical protein